MMEASRQQELVDTLKAFNNSVVSIRLYPEGAPQITNAVERGYKLLKQHLRHRGMFILGLRDADAVLCGEIVPAETLQSISNLIVYRQLDLLGLRQLVIAPGLDRASFNKILDIFAAKVEQVKREGGGWAFATRLGLDGFFPEEAPVRETSREDTRLVEEVPEVPKVPREYINVLLGLSKDTGLVSRVGQLMFTVEKGSLLLTVAVKEILQEVVKKNLFAATPDLRDLFTSAGSMVPGDTGREFAERTAALLLKYLGLQELTLLLCQNFIEGFGGLIEAELVRQIPTERFDRVVNGLRQKSSQLRLTLTNESPQLVFISGSLDRLLVTPKGKQFLGQEKAKSILRAGEKNRRAKRVQAGIKSLMQGNLEMLKSDEFCLHLPLVVKKLHEDGRDKEVQAVLRVLARNIDSMEGGDRARLTGSLAGIGENLVRKKRWESVKIIIDPIRYWLNHSSDGDATYGKVCFILQALMNRSFTSGDFQLGDSILSSMYKIRSGVVKKPESVRSMVARAQDRAVDRQLLVGFVEESLANPADEILGRRIILQGPVALRYLVDCLVKAEESQDRFKLIDLLTYGDRELPPVLVEKLSEPMPWYGKRNVLKLLADCGGEEHIDVACSFLGSEDLRVQREAFVCIYKISGSKRKSTLLRALHDAGETMKLQVVRALTIFDDGQVVQGLAQVLEDHQYYSEEFRDTLLTETCHSLARCQPQESEKTLSNFLDQRNSRQTRKIGAPVWQAAGEALAEVRERQQDEVARQAQISKRRKNLVTQMSSARLASQQKKSITGLAEERKIQELIEKGGDLARAKVMLLDLITKVARLKRFNQAEQLRDWLVEVDDTALTEIIRAAEIIDGEKGAAGGDGQAEIWAGLFDVLTGEEFNALYNALVFKKYLSEELIIKRGVTQDSLFFINSGGVKLFYREGGNEILVKVLNSGEVFGVETFFEASVSTLSAAAMGKVEIGQLSLDRLEKLSREHPGLESKLQSFSSTFKDVEDFFSRSGKDRRIGERYKLSCPVSTTLLDADGNSSGVSIAGELMDISDSGASFFMHIAKEQNSRLLLGRGLRLSLMAGEKVGERVLTDGVVRAVRPQHGMELGYSVHVEFSEQLQSRVLQDILADQK